MASIWYQQGLGDETWTEMTNRLESEKQVRRAIKKARVDARPVLTAIQACNPEHEDFILDKDGLLPAIKVYENQGVEPWIKSFDCWKSGVQGHSFVRAVVEIGPDEWSAPLHQPEINGYKIVTSCPPGQDFLTRLNKQEDNVIKKGEFKDEAAYWMEFMGVGGKVRITVTSEPYTRSVPIRGRSYLFYLFWFSV